MEWRRSPAPRVDHERMRDLDGFDSWVEDVVSTALDAGIPITFSDEMIDAFERLYPGALGTTVDERVRAYRERMANPETVVWLVESVIRAASLAVVFGDSKTAKSTLMRCLCMAVAAGLRRFLGQPCATGPALYVSLDEPDDTVDMHLSEIWREGAPFTLHQDYGGRNLPKPSARFDWLTEWAQDIEPEVIVIDTLGKFVDMPEGALHDYTYMSKVMGDFQRLAADTGAAVAVIHHAAKNEIGRRTPLGSAQIEASADSLITVSKREEVRYMQVSGRAVGMPKIRLDYADGWIRAGMTAKAETARDMRAELLAVIEAKPGELTRTDAVKAAGVDRNKGMDMLKAMDADGTVESKPKDGRRGFTLWPGNNGMGYAPYT